MSSNINQTTTGRMQRARGIAKISFKRRAHLTVLDDLFQQGSARVKLARAEPGRPCEAVLINTSGGMTGGDEFECQANWGKETTAIVTSQAAERFYKSHDGSARVTSHLSVGENACGLWLPQETIMFDGAAYEKNTLIEVASSSQTLAVETSIFGRHAMGEMVERGSLIERWQVRCDGRLIFADAFGLDGAVNTQLESPVVAAGAKAISTMIYFGPEAETVCDLANKMIETAGGKGRASSFDGLAIIRLFALDGQGLRTNLVQILNELLIMITHGKKGENLLPRVWTM